MKKLILFFLIFIFVIYSSIFSTSRSQSDFGSHVYYKDKILHVEIKNIQAEKPETLENFIKRIVSDGIQDKVDAIILSIDDFFNMKNTTATAIKKNLQFVKTFSDLLQKNGIKLFIEIKFDSLTGNILSTGGDSKWLDNFRSLVKTTEIEGFYYSDIDLASAEQINLFEDILVEAAMYKPFLLSAISSKSSTTDKDRFENYIRNGIIDFILDEYNNYSICINNFINIPAQENLLQNYLKNISPDKFVSLDLRKIHGKYREIKLLSEKRIKTLNPVSKLNFISLTKADTIKLQIGDSTVAVSKNDWVIPYNYVLNKDNTVSRDGMWIEFRRPFDRITRSDTYSLLCRTSYPAEVTINNQKVKIYNTGVFFDKIKLNEGLNNLLAEAKNKNGETVIYEDRVFYKKKILQDKISELAIQSNSIQPNENLTLTEKDEITITFNGTKGQKGYIEILPSKKIFNCSREDFGSFSKYKTRIFLKDFSKDQPHHYLLHLKPEDESAGLAPVEKELSQHFVIKDVNNFPLVITTQDNSIFPLTLAPIRLGAPLRGELPKNVTLRTDGIIGDYYRIYLNDNEEGFINKEFVKELPIEAAAPGYFLNPINCSATDSADIIKIPYLENVPFDVYPDPAQKRITITLYGVKSSSTWIIHKPNLRYIDQVTWQQTSKETYRIYVNLNTAKIWGYDLKPNGKELIFKIKYPPTFNLNSSLPLKGIKFSIEAGHGGNNNTGAVGLSGLKEKDINLKLSLLLGKLLKEKGAEVFQVRNEDKNMTLLERRDLAINSRANIHLSIHANSSDPENEFLGTSGTCTFFHNPFWEKFGESVFNRMLELDLKPFGYVGSFNYRVTRMSDMPAILVEQAFMSNAEDEEKLADDNFRKNEAIKIYKGILDFLKYMNN